MAKPAADPELIYNQHRNAFECVSAHVVLSADGKLIARVAFKWSRTSDRVWAYVHMTGAHMVRGFAEVGNYDKHSAAVSNAAAKISVAKQTEEQAAFVAALLRFDGGTWERFLREAGFTVHQAV
jgi:hypothetical protein